MLGLKLEASRREQTGANDNAKPEHGVRFGITARRQAARGRTTAPGRVSNGYPGSTSFSLWQMIASADLPSIRATQAKAVRENGSQAGASAARYSQNRRISRFT